jgi:pimeloyl-ACP methyl ester carboxylesterase
MVATAEGSGLLPLFLSPDWARPRPEVIRVLIIFHGNGRNANSYFNTAKKARRLAGEQGRGTLIIAPQFVAEVDLKNDLPDDAYMLLRWTTQTWKDGEPALGPVSLSSFEAIDAVLARLADRTIFPNLVHVVVAGHSAGGQIVHIAPSSAPARASSQRSVCTCATLSPIHSPTPISTRTGRTRPQTARRSTTGSTASRSVLLTPPIRRRRRLDLAS